MRIHFTHLWKSKSLARQIVKTPIKRSGLAFIVLRKHLMGSVLGRSQLSEDYFHTDNLEIRWEGLFAFNFECHYGKGPSYRISFSSQRFICRAVFHFFTGRLFLNKMVNHTRLSFTASSSKCAVLQNQNGFFWEMYLFIYFWLLDVIKTIFCTLLKAKIRGIFHSDATEEPYLVPQRPFQWTVL